MSTNQKSGGIGRSALAISALPTSWLGGYWFVKRQAS